MPRTREGDLFKKGTKKIRNGMTKGLTCKTLIWAEKIILINLFEGEKCCIDVVNFHPFLSLVIVFSSTYEKT